MALVRSKYYIGPDHLPNMPINSHYRKKKKLNVSFLVPNGPKKILTRFLNFLIFLIMFIIDLDDQGHSPTGEVLRVKF